MIEIKKRELLINNASAGSVEDALRNYPDLVPEIWALMIERNNSREALEIDLENVKSEIAALNLSLAERSGQVLALSTDNAHLAKEAALVPVLQAELEMLKMPLSQANARVISPSDFRSRFTDEQLTAIATWAMSDSTVPVFLIKLATAQSIDLDSPNTRAALAYIDASVPIDWTLF